MVETQLGWGVLSSILPLPLVMYLFPIYVLCTLGPGRQQLLKVWWREQSSSGRHQLFLAPLSSPPPPRPSGLVSQAQELTWPCP